MANRRKKEPAPAPPSDDGKISQRASDSRALRQPREPEVRSLLHELRVHQVELELQNEELRAARLESETALARYTEVFDFAPIGYATVGAEYTILESNYAGAQLLGLPRSQLQGRPLLHLVHPAHHSVLRSLISAAESSGSKQSATVDLLRHPGQLFPARLSIMALSRTEPGLLLAFEDVTELEKHRQQLEQSERALREADRRKDDFLALLSHELRNPLAPIKTSLFLLEQADPGSDAAQRAHQIIDRQVTHLTHLIDQLLDVTLIGQGKVKLELEPVELGALSSRAIEDHRASFDAQGVGLFAGASAPVWVHGDPARLAQVLSSLLSNALKLTARGGRVHVGWRAEEKHAVLSVSDTGSGIARELLEHVFEPFVQSPQTAERSGGGLGLGLALVKGLVELHGGGVVVRSGGESKGTDVTLRLPRIAPPELSPPETTSPPHRSRRVLVIEDNVDAAETLQAALEMLGHEVRSAADGARGLALAATFQPEVVLCDLGLPGMDGFAVARTLRSQAAAQPLLLVALTGYARPDDLQRTRQAGFDAHLARPASVATLERIIAGAGERQS